MNMEVQQENLKGRHLVCDLEVDERIILNRVSKK
jgi:hypothetical protein